MTFKLISLHGESIFLHFNLPACCGSFLNENEYYLLNCNRWVHRLEGLVFIEPAQPCRAGKIFLAFIIPEPRAFCETLDLSPHTPNTDSTPESVLASIAQTRKQGVAMDEEEYVPGVRCVAAPVKTPLEKPSPRSG